ncbi:MAG TPA: NAD(P)(+) transhydrogenase (Re/Si-specific) subunit alpha, partial [Micromonosporaceae bacterium]|nr:NAD(P)(+) transhydrogenase (Re/Si-specific) subunit alpha [Micromonosporaceae bacterium]
MRVAVVKEARPAERRVALVPQNVSRLTKAGLTVHVEPGAGAAAGFPDEAFAEQGAEVSPDAVDGADVLLAVQPPTVDQVNRLAPGGLIISFLPTAQELELIRAVRDGGRTAMAMELIPRISRAQSMDALSSQALVAGYRCAIVAAERLPRFFPMSITAAGNVPPASVLVIGAGVAGLQAIATARRLGAVVSGYDVRTEAAEQIASLGAKPITLEVQTEADEAGYARELAEDHQARQLELLAPHVEDSDVVITTAQIP